jgi:hypothetical protein
VARYVAQYVVSPPISVRRIDRYDGARVTSHYRAHRTGRMEHETRIVKIFELAFPLKVMLLSSPAHRLVFRPTITHTQRP